MSTVSMSQMQEEFREFYGLIRAIIYRRLRSVLERFDDELQGEAEAIAWEQFATCRQRVSEPKHAAVCAAKSGVCRVLRGGRFVRRERGYRDALDRRNASSASPGVLAGIVAADNESVITDSLDRGPVEALIGRLPVAYQQTARLLSLGCQKQRVAQQCGVSPATISAHVDVIAVFVQAMLDERTGA